MKRLSLVVLLAAAVTIVAGAIATGDADGQKLDTVSVQILGINDFHGNIEPPSGRIANVDAGGVEFLATHIANLEATNPNSIVVAAGDSIGASPLISALFKEEPTIEALSLAGLDLASVGNHEFDKGSAELKRLQNGGCHKDGCQDGDPFEGAKFQFLSGNVFANPTAAEKAAARKQGKRARPKPLFAPYVIKEIGGVKVGFIGLTLEATPTIVTPAGVAGLMFYPEAYMANYWVQNLRKAGVKTIVVLMHEGGIQSGSFNDCNGISDPLRSIVEKMSSDIDVVVSGHTHQAYNCRIGNKVVTGASAFGRIISDIDLTIDRATGDVVAKTATNRIVTRDVPRHAAATALVEKYKRLSAPLANRVIGRITGDITRAENAALETALGDVIADAQLAATKAPAKGGSVVAFMNPGGIRADLLANQISGGEQVGQVTYGEAFTVQPFGNTVVVKTLTGAQIKALLEQQFDNGSPGRIRILQVSNGFTYSYNASRPAGSRVDAASIKINGAVVGPSTEYRVTMNSFLATGGDNFTVFNQGTRQLGGEVDLDALIAYFAANPSVAPGPQNRITRTG